MRNPGDDMLVIDRPDECRDAILRELRYCIVEQSGDFLHPMPTPAPVRWPTPKAEPINEFTTEGHIVLDDFRDHIITRMACSRLISPKTSSIF